MAARFVDCRRTAGRSNNGWRSDSPVSALETICGRLGATILDGLTGGNLKLPRATVGVPLDSLGFATDLKLLLLRGKATAAVPLELDPHGMTVYPDPEIRIVTMLALERPVPASPRT